MIAKTASEAIGLDLKVRRPADGEMWGNARPSGSNQNHTGNPLTLTF